MYGYAKMLKCLGCFFRSSAGSIEPVGISEVVGALESKTLLSRHFFWYFFSIPIKVSLFSVCRTACQPQSFKLSRPLAFSIFKVFAVAPATPFAAAIAVFVRENCKLKTGEPCEATVSEIRWTSVIRDLLERSPRNMRDAVLDPHRYRYY